MGLDSESPNDHIADFVERCDTITAKDLSMEAVHMRLFPFSLKYKAKAWLKSELVFSETSLVTILKISNGTYSELSDYY